MRARRLRLVLGTAVLVAAVGALSSVVVPAHAAGVLAAAFSKDSDWGSGYQGRYTIANGTAAGISSWKVEFDLPAGTTVGSFWDALVTRSGTHVTAVNRDYNGTVVAGASVSFGFIVSGSGVPSGCTLNGGPCAGVADNTPPTAPAGLHVTGTTSGSVSLVWTASTDNVGVTGYDVLAGGTRVGGGTGTATTILGLNPSTTYTFTVRAHDAAGNSSAASNAVSANTASGGGGGVALPVAPYVDMGSWPTPVLTDMATAGHLKAFTLAFVNSAGCRASWFNAFDPRTAWSRDQIDAIRANGGDVKISFGGENGIELAQACSTAQQVATEYQAVVDAYQLTYVDFDIEGAAVAEPASIARRSQAFKLLQNARPTVKISLTLPVLPEGLTADGLNVVRSARDAGVNLDMVNIMAMDYYRAGDYGDFAIAAANATFSQLKGLYPGKSDAQVRRMLGVTPMLGQNDDGHVFALSDAQDLVANAASKHLGMLAFWEQTRDRNACTGALFQCTNVTQQPYDYSRIFAGFTG